MNLEELRSVRNTERQKDSLQELRPSFYQDVGEYIGRLEAERDEIAAAHEDPFASPEVARLTDEIEAAKDVAEAIYERRMGKLVKQASLAAAGMTANSEGLTSEEAALFDDLVERIETNKTEILSVLEGRTADTRGGRTDRTETVRETGAVEEGTLDETEATTEAPPAPPSDEPPVETDPAERAEEDSFDVADAMGSATDTAGASEGRRDETVPPNDPSAAIDEPAAGEDSTTADPADEADGSTDVAGTDADEAVDRVTVQITSDVGSILGVDDREYTLASDDVVTLPEANADPLIERDAAKPLE
ncbi:hypothetical protein [Halovivax cerinus]|uniref:GINS subunit domain-containing protein n=1 Tax=Halovivax cerinus TaxID=1487865 RepID=A0ABD5NNN4_9EURY